MPAPPVIWEDPDKIRDRCRCPNPACRVIWTHFEGKGDRHRSFRDTEAYVKAHYGPDRPYQCPECGTWSVLRNTYATFWEAVAGTFQWRIIVPPPETARASAGREDEPGDDRASYPPAHPHRFSDATPAAVPTAVTAATIPPRFAQGQAARQDAFVRKARCKQLLGVVGIGLFILLTILLQLSR
jgi:hypothetical protein